MSSDLLFKDEVYKIIGAAIEVHRELGSTFLEPIYHEALERELTFAGVPHVSQQQLIIFYKGVPLNKRYCADLLCYDKVVLELKALNRLSPIEEAQLINYLSATRMQLGLLINFGSKSKLEWKRMIL